MSSTPLAPTRDPFITLFCRDICDGAEGEGGIGSSPLIYTFLDAHLAAFTPPRREGCRRHLWQVSRDEAARRQLLMGINRARWDGFGAGGAKDRDVNTNAVMNVEGVGGGGRTGGGRRGRPYLVKTHRRGGGRDRGDGVHKGKLLLHVSRVSDKRRERRRSRRLLPVRTSRPRGDRAIYVLMALIDGTTHDFSGAHARLNKYARKGQSLC